MPSNPDDEEEEDEDGIDGDDARLRNLTLPFSPPSPLPPPLSLSLPTRRINGHEHNYERNYAVINKTLATGASSGQPGGNASNPEVLTDPTAPIYIVTGCAGDVEHHEPFTRPQPAYSAFRSNTYGYARMTIYNATTLLWEAVQTDNEYPETTGTVIDAMLVVNNKH
jgi:hypothetical protein